MVNPNISIASIEKSMQALRSVFKTEALIELFIEKQLKEFSIIRKTNPEINRNEVIKISFFNAAIKLKNENNLEKYSLASIRKSKATPQLDWLKLHRSFVINLKLNGASLREIKRAIFFRFHHEISHTEIAKFLKMEMRDV